MVEIIVDPEKCTGCGSCVDACHRRVLQVIDGICKPVNIDMCRFCMLCAPRCRQKALTIKV